MRKFFIHNTKYRGEGRSLYITPTGIIKYVIEDLISKFPDLKTKLWIDPCAGDGRWGKIASVYGIECIGYDIEPLDPNVHRLDFLNQRLPITDNIFIIGNPPYNLADKFVNRALSVTDMCYFLAA